eukprot:TRINITY_DN3288_c1_g1_i4.p1 TRINITY_DN3288_c1_g1~~TRINITY_DN3288_c1_g1_i4.p1  ORF type:complete len:1583 (+),score=530.93 TRINITY_DN3288_c1_g1_i4:327-5075(+)
MSRTSSTPKKYRTFRDSSLLTVGFTPPPTSGGRRRSYSDRAEIPHHETRSQERLFDDDVPAVIPDVKENVPTSTPQTRPIIEHREPMPPPQYSEFTRQVITPGGIRCMIKARHYIIVAGRNGFIRVFSTSGFEELRTIRLPGIAERDTVRSLLFMDSENSLLCGLSNGQIYVHDMKTRTSRPISQPHRAVVSSMVRYKNLIWTASHDWAIHIYRATDYKRLTQLNEHGNQVTCLAVVPTKHLIASGGADKVIRLWNAETRTVSVLFQGHTDVITNICISPGDDVLWSISHDEVVRVWSLDTFEIKFRCQSHAAAIESLAVLNTLNLVFSGDKNSNIFVVDGVNGAFVECIKVGGKPVTALLAEGDWLCGIVGDSELVVWKMSRGKSVEPPSTGAIHLDGGVQSDSTTTRDIEELQKELIKEREKLIRLREMIRKRDTRHEKSEKDIVIELLDQFIWSSEKLEAIRTENEALNERLSRKEGGQHTLRGIQEMLDAFQTYIEDQNIGDSAVDQIRIDLAYMFHDLKAELMNEREQICTRIAGAQAEKVKTDKLEEELVATKALCAELAEQNSALMERHREVSQKHARQEKIWWEDREELGTLRKHVGEMEKDAKRFSSEKEVLVEEIVILRKELEASRSRERIMEEKVRQYGRVAEHAVSMMSGKETESGSLTLDADDDDTFVVEEPQTIMHSLQVARQCAAKRDEEMKALKDEIGSSQLGIEGLISALSFELVHRSEKVENVISDRIEKMSESLQESFATNSAKLSDVHASVEHIGEKISEDDILNKMERLEAEVLEMRESLLSLHSHGLKALEKGVSSVLAVAHETKDDVSKLSVSSDSRIGEIESVLRKSMEEIHSSISASSKQLVDVIGSRVETPLSELVTKSGERSVDSISRRLDETATRIFEPLREDLRLIAEKSEVEWRENDARFRKTAEMHTSKLQAIWHEVESLRSSHHKHGVGRDEQTKKDAVEVSASLRDSLEQIPETLAKTMQTLLSDEMEKLDEKIFTAHQYPLQMFTTSLTKKLDSIGDTVGNVSSQLTAEHERTRELVQRTTDSIPGSVVASLQSQEELVRGLLSELREHLGRVEKKVEDVMRDEQTREALGEIRSTIHTLLVQEIQAASKGVQNHVDQSLEAGIQKIDARHSHAEETSMGIMKEIQHLCEVVESTETRSTRSVVETLEETSKKIGLLINVKEMVESVSEQVDVLTGKVDDSALNLSKNFEGVSASLLSASTDIQALESSLRDVKSQMTSQMESIPIEIRSIQSNANTREGAIQKSLDDMRMHLSSRMERLGTQVMEKVDETVIDEEHIVSRISSTITPELADVVLHKGFEPIDATVAKLLEEVLKVSSMLDSDRKQTSELVGASVSDVGKAVGKLHARIDEMCGDANVLTKQLHVLETSLRSVEESLESKLPTLHESLKELRVHVESVQDGLRQGSDEQSKTMMRKLSELSTSIESITLSLSSPSEKDVKSAPFVETEPHRMWMDAAVPVGEWKKELMGFRSSLHQFLGTKETKAPESHIELMNECASLMEKTMEEMQNILVVRMTEETEKNELEALLEKYRTYFKEQMCMVETGPTD